MNIFITTQVFPPEIHPTAELVKELAEHLSLAGHKVFIGAGFPHHPYGRLYPGYQTKWIKIETNNGYKVIRGWHWVASRNSVLERSLAMATQAGAFAVASTKIEKPAVVVSFGPPLLGPVVSSLIAGKFNAKVVTIIYDIYPDILIQSGQQLPILMIKILKQLEQRIYRQADKVVVLSEGLKKLITVGKNVDISKVAVIPVWLDKKDVFPMERDNAWRREVGIPSDKFVVLYAGTIGLVSGADIVVDAALRLKDRKDILFVFVGEGRLKEKVMDAAAASGLDNIRFIPFQPRSRLPELQSVSDVSLVTLAPGRGKTSVPSKILGYMAASRPVIASVDLDCDTAETVRNARCGVVVPPGDADALSEAVMYYYSSSNVRKRDGESGYRYFLSHFEKEVVLNKYICIIDELHCSGKN